MFRVNSYSGTCGNEPFGTESHVFVTRSVMLKKHPALANANGQLQPLAVAKIEILVCCRIYRAFHSSYKWLQ